MVSGGIRAASDCLAGDTERDAEAGRRVTTSAPNSPWTPERVEQLVALNAEGYSSSVIGAYLGLSRNAVIGRIHRMGIGRGKPVIVKAREPRDGKPMQSATVLRFRPRPDGYKERAAEIVPLGLDLIDLEPDQCRFPYGDGPFTFCGHKKQEGSSYCPDHFALTWKESR